MAGWTHGQAPVLWPLSCSGRAARWLARTQRKATVARCEAACEAVNRKLAMGGTGSARVPPQERSCPREPDAQAAHRLRSAHAELSTLTVTELPQASRSLCELRPRVKARPTLQGPCPRATAIERARCAAGSLTRPCSHTVLRDEQGNTLISVRSCRRWRAERKARSGLRSSKGARVDLLMLLCRKT